MSNDSISTEVLVIGGGPGGYPAAFRLADLGHQVTLVEMEPNPGGVCLYRGCIPSKALLHTAALLNETSEAEQMGLKFQRPEIDIDRMREWKNSVVKRLTGGLGSLVKARKVNYVRGRATFTGSHEVKVDLHDGGEQEIRFEKAVIATGSRPTKIPIFPDSPRVLYSTSALEIADIPKRLLVVGGGYSGLELGTVYAALGSSVDVVEMMPALLPGADPDLAAPLQKRLKHSLKNILVDTKVVSAREVDGGIEVEFQGANVKESKVVYDKVLVSVGRRPNSENIGLDAAGVELAPRGFIKVDAQRRTSQDHIWAIGDVAGDPMLAHKATHEGVVAAEAIHGKKTIFDPLAIPAVVFTDPEIAWVGLTESDAKERGIPVKVAKFPWAASGRAITLERTEGLTKIIADEHTGRLLGLGIVGVRAGDMISEGALAIEMGATVEDLALTIHPHPTLSESVMEAAEVFFGHSAHFIAKR